jgi:hypothetical protein
MVAMTETKFCRDCKWCHPRIVPGGVFRKPKPDYREARCANPNLPYTVRRKTVMRTEFLVSGEVIKENVGKDAPLCWVARECNSECGADAKYFEDRS